MVALVAGNVIVVESVPDRAKLLFAVRVLPSAIVNVDPVAGAVNVTLLMVVAVATPREGVTSEGDVARTMLPEPVVAFPRAVTVPELGRVRDVLADTVKDVVNAPVNDNAPPRVIVDPEALATPVPPFVSTSVPPTVNVPLVVIGEPLNVSPVVPPLAATLVTVPDPPPPDAAIV